MSRTPMALIALSVALLASVAASTERSLTVPARQTIEIADLTWLELRQAVRQGSTTVLVPSGGLEQNGPQMAIGKHDMIVGSSGRAIAHALGQTLVAPVISYVPEGDWEPPTGNMTYPGTIGVSEAAYAATLEGVARSLKRSGFRLICLVADHGGSVGVQRDVAARLSRDWRAEGVRVLDVDEYYEARGQLHYLTEHGETAATIGDHAGLSDTAELMAVRPDRVDLSQAGQAGWSWEQSGASGDPARATAEIGRALLAIKIDAAVRQIEAARKTRQP